LLREYGDKLDEGIRDEAMLYTALCYEHKLDFTSALRTYLLKLSLLSPQSNAYLFTKIRIGYCYLQLGDYEKALNTWEDCLKEMPPPFITPTFSWLIENYKRALPLSVSLHRQGTSHVVGSIYMIDITFKMDFAKGKVLVIYGVKKNGSKSEISAADAAYQWKWRIQLSYGYTLPCREASSLSPEELKDNDLVVFGNPQTNEVLASLLPSLPIKIGENRIEVANRVYEGEDIGVAMLAPNPYNKDKFLLVYCASQPSYLLDILDTHHGMAEYVIFKGNEESKITILEAGFFLKISPEKWEAFPTKEEVQ